jgi:DNA-binding transcriptional MerR regulator
VNARSYLSIGQVLDLLKEEFPDLTISKIRFLESQGLLDPERTPSGYRKFYDPDVERLRFILRAQQDQYLPLKVIKGRLGEDEGPDAPGESDGAPNGDAAPAALAAPVRERREDVDLGASRHPSVVAAPAAALHAVADEEHESLTLEELATVSGLSTADLSELERFGLLTGRRIAGTTYYDADCATIAAIAARFRVFGVEARHLRMYRTAVEREAGFFEQVVTPMLKQRNPQARRQAVDALLEMSRLGSAMREAVLRLALREHTGGAQ